MERGTIGPALPALSIVLRAPPSEAGRGEVQVQRSEPCPLWALGRSCGLGKGLGGEVLDGQSKSSDF